MLYFAILLGIFCFVNVNHAQTSQCKQLDDCVCNSNMPYGESRLRARRRGTGGSSCDLEYCFGNNRVLFDTSVVSFSPTATMVAQNCRAGFLDNQNLPNCAANGLAYVQNFGCKLCGCTSSNSIVWKEITRYGRTCRGFICKNVTTLGFNCGIDTGMRYVPKLSTTVRQNSFGIIRGPTNNGRFGRIATNDYISEYSEFSTFMGPTWSCPPDTTQMCANNPDMTLNASSLGTGIMYMNGSRYFKRDVWGSTCSVYTCSQGAWGTPLNYVNGSDIKTNAALTAFVQENCVSENNLGPCLWGTTPLYYEFSSSQCSNVPYSTINGYTKDRFNTNSRATFCAQFYCGCPTTKGVAGSTWYLPLRQARGRPAGGSSGVSTLADTWTGYTYTCNRYSCSHRPNMPVNKTSWVSAQSSGYSNVDPCDFNLGFTNAVGKYWTNGGLSDYNLYLRSSIIANGNPTRGSNATCMALGMGTCWEVKYYPVNTYTRTGGCPGAQSTTANCPTTGTQCDRTQIYRAPVNGYIDVAARKGRWVGTRLQCYPDGTNLAQQPYCMKNTQMQNAYENRDRCFNNANFQWNIRPKAVSGGGCSTGARSFQLAKGVCDHSIFRNYVQHVGDCYCAFVRSLNAGADFPGKETSIQNEFYTIFDSNSATTASPETEYVRSFVSTLALYGCTYAPMKCLPSGKVSFSVDRLSISGTFKVNNACEFANVNSIRADLESYFGNAGVVSASPNNKMRVFNIQDGTNTCTMQFKAFVSNRVWADYLVKNATMSGNGGALYGSITNLVINSELTTTGAGSRIQIYVGLFVAVFALLW